MPVGALVNSLAIAVGASIGMLLRVGLPEKYQKSIMQALGLAVAIIGIKMSLASQNSVIMVMSLALGTVIGEMCYLDDRLARFGAYLTECVGNRFGDIGTGFVNASLIFCIGAMGIIGSLQEGLSGDASIIYTKSLIDGIIAAVMSASLGLGVMLSGLPVFIYQGSITLLALFLQDYMTEPMLAEINGTGGILIVAIGLNMIGITKIKLANMLPSLPCSVILVGLGWL